MCTISPLSPLAQVTATSPNEEIPGGIWPEGQASVWSLPRNNLVRTWAHSSSPNALHSIQAGTGAKFFDSKGTVGDYRQWMIQCKQVSASLEPRASNMTKGKNLKLHIVTPKHQLDRPLPANPSFGRFHDHIRSASAETFSIYDVSPISDTEEPHVHNAVVCPTNSQQQQLAKDFCTSIYSSTFGHDSDLLDEQKISIASHSSLEELPSDDGSSVYSMCSSRTSAGARTPLKQPIIMNFDGCSANSIFSIQSPISAGVFDDEASAIQKSNNAGAEIEQSLSTSSMASRQKYTCHSPTEIKFESKPTHVHRPLKMCSDTPQATPRRRLTITDKSTNDRNPLECISHGRSFLASTRMNVINQAIFRSETRQLSPHIASPTLSAAEDDLERYLTSSLTDCNSIELNELVQRKFSIRAFGLPPGVPQKSSKRQPHFASSNSRHSHVPSDHIASQLGRDRTIARKLGLRIKIPGDEKRMMKDFVVSPFPALLRTVERIIIPDDADNAILKIFQNLDTLDDMFAAAVVNRTFYRVFKCYELDLMKDTLRKMSPPAWEHREICFPGHDRHDLEDLETVRVREEYTPTTYLQHYRRDAYIIAALKSLIKQECHSFLRPETSVALSAEPPVSSRVDNALWCIWTFCKIFGCGKGREDDEVAQIDWLNGGILVHQNTCTHSIFTTDELEIRSALASAPEYFAKGNEGGLTAEELYDMMEIWNCLGFLLHPILGCLIEARQYGILNDIDASGGGINGEAAMLEEWYYYLLTLGLSPIFELVVSFSQSKSSAFLLAQRNGWINWKTPFYKGTRRNFLKKATSRVYKDRIAINYCKDGMRRK